MYGEYILSRLGICYLSILVLNTELIESDICCRLYSGPPSFLSLTKMEEDMDKEAECMENIF